MATDEDKTLYELDTANDLIAWETKEIRSHRYPKSNTRQLITGALLLMVFSMVLTIAFNGTRTSDAGSMVALPGAEAPEPTEDPSLSVPDGGTPPVALPPIPPVEDKAEKRAERASRSKERTPPPPPPVSKIETVIKFALAQQGKPYRWANSGPSGYDCSGLVMRSFLQVGVSLPHYTGTMMGRGSRISRSAMQRGDIVFPASGHVGIYLGNDMMVHASSSKGRVVVAKVYSFYTARRLL